MILSESRSSLFEILLYGGVIAEVEGAFFEIERRRDLNIEDGLMGGITGGDKSCW